jgi:metal-dependent amidase/aminoacylase/carboxypeptidase family protein
LIEDEIRHLATGIAESFGAKAHVVFEHICPPTHKRDRRSRGCQSFAAIAKDQRTTPASHWGQPCRPHPRFSRSKCHIVI